MFMRLLQVHTKSDSFSILPVLYNDNVLPELRKAPGCLYGGLIQNVHDPDECISMTMWDTPEHAEAYEQHGLFQRLLKQAEHFFSDSLEWKVQLSKDLTLNYAPIPDEPVVMSHSVSASVGGGGQKLSHGRMYVRILSIKLLAGKLEEFARLYNELIIPTLRSVQGCQYAFLTEGIEERSEVLSVTIWDSKEDADEYESKGIFDLLRKKVQHTFSEVYQWKLAADRSTQRRIAANDNISVRRYDVVAGRSYQ